MGKGIRNSWRNGHDGYFGKSEPGWSSLGWMVVDLAVDSYLYVGTMGLWPAWKAAYQGFSTGDFSDLGFITGFNGVNVGIGYGGASLWGRIFGRRVGTAPAAGNAARIAQLEQQLARARQDLAWNLQQAEHTLPGTPLGQHFATRIAALRAEIEGIETVLGTLR